MKRTIIVCFTALVLMFTSVPTSAAAEYGYTDEPVWFSVEFGGILYQIPAFFVDNTPVFKLRELALLLEPTTARFSVEWEDHAVVFQNGGTYVPIGGELSPPTAGMPVSKAPPITADGELRNVPAWLIGQNIYIPLEALGALLRYGSVSVDTDTCTAEIKSVCLQEHENDNQYVVSLFLDSTTAYCNGEEVTLSAAPFLQEGIFLYPLQDMVQLYHGTYFFDGQFAHIDMDGVTLICALGKREFICNGESYSVTHYNRFTAEPVYVPAPDEYVPQLVDGVVFVPLDFFGSRFSWGSSLQLFPQDRMAIWGRFYNESGTDHVKLEYYYDLIPQELRSVAVCDGIVDRVLSYDVIRYRLEGMEIYVLDCSVGKDMEWMNGRICGIRITTPCYPTPRGLQVGDSKEKVIHLYGSYLGDTHLPNKMKIEFENEQVKSLYFSTRYY